MSKMQPISIEALLNWIIKEYQQSQTIFGVRKFFQADQAKTITILDHAIENPIGPEAGPQTQFSQSLVSSYLSGARFFELKTVQLLAENLFGETATTIAARDEGYYLESAAGFALEESLAEYIKAWFLIQIVAKEFQLGNPTQFMFNLSLKTQAAWLKKPAFSQWLDQAKDVEQTNTWQACLAAAHHHLADFQVVDDAYLATLSTQMVNSVTLIPETESDLAEMSQTAEFLFNEKRLQVLVAATPSLLGVEKVRKRLNQLGFDYVALDESRMAPQAELATFVERVQALQEKALTVGKQVGVKVMGTLPVHNIDSELVEKEIDLSGRTVFPLTVELAAKLSEQLPASTPLAYAGGADIFNIKDLFEAGIAPITVKTTIAKPGGYERLTQLANVVTSLEYAQHNTRDAQQLATFTTKAYENFHYQARVKFPSSSKIKAKVPLLNCFTAPCKASGGCPISQDVPAYLRLVDEGNYLEAFKVILDKNPLPFITGTICAHPCEAKCTRQFYEEAVDVRGVKLTAAERAYDEFMATAIKPERLADAEKTAIIGGGPAGIAASFLLAREGMPVTVFEKAEVLGGVCSQVIPEFRLKKEKIDRDIALAAFMGAEFVTGAVAPSVTALKEQGYEKVIYATGAWAGRALSLTQGTAINSLDFLQNVRYGLTENPYGEHIVVVGGGNTAMDCARAASRLPNVQSVSLVYRREVREMPADEEEIQLVLAEDIPILSLLSPVSLTDGELTCQVMKMGERDETGRKPFIATDETRVLPATTVISAIGEAVDGKFFNELGIEVDDRGCPVLDAKTNETNLPGVFVIGDASFGPATIVEAIADATRACSKITRIHNSNYKKLNVNPDNQAPLLKRGILSTPDQPLAAASSCLECQTVCEACVDACPNRANVVVELADKPQIVHIEQMCNDCGNCETFCPYSSAPYQEKMTLFHSAEAFSQSDNQGFFVEDCAQKLVQVRMNGKVVSVDLNEKRVPIGRPVAQLINTVMEQYDYYLVK